MGLYLDSGDWITHIAVDVLNPEKLFLATESLDVYRTRNGGRSLTAIMRAGRAASDPVAELLLETFGAEE